MGHSKKSHELKKVWLTHNFTPKWLTTARKVTWQRIRIIDTSKYSRILRRIIQIKQWRKNYKALYYWFLPGNRGQEIEKAKNKPLQLMDTTQENETETERRIDKVDMRTLDKCLQLIFILTIAAIVVSWCANFY